MKSTLLTIAFLFPALIGFSQEKANHNTSRTNKKSSIGQTSGFTASKQIDRNSIPKTFARAGMSILVEVFQSEFPEINSYEQFIKQEGISEKSFSRTETALIKDIYSFVSTKSSSEKILSRYNGTSLINLLDEMKRTGEEPFTQLRRTFPKWKKFWDRVVDTVNIIDEAVNAICCTWESRCCG